jgi:tetratricopeptide (TPR) repeat protein
LGRSQESSGQLDLALKSYQEAAAGSPSANAALRAAVEFLVARVSAKKALADPAQAADAIAKLKAFLQSQRDHYRFFDAQLLLGEVAIAANDNPTADSAFASLAEAPWPDYQMAGKIGSARLLFARGDADAAKQAFDAVAAMNATTPSEVARKLEAMLGQAKCLQAKNQHAEAVKILDEVVKQSSPTDARLQAEAYVRQGQSYGATGENAKQAIMAYLHVDVIPALSQETDLHAEALYHLSQLWPAAGQPGRGAESSAKLEQLYPNSEWAKKLGGG